MHAHAYTRVRIYLFHVYEMHRERKTDGERRRGGVIDALSRGFLIAISCDITLSGRLR